MNLLPHFHNSIVALLYSSFYRCNKMISESFNSVLNESLLFSRSDINRMKRNTYLENSNFGKIAKALQVDCDILENCVVFLLLGRCFRGVKEGLISYFSASSVLRKTDEILNGKFLLFSVINLSIGVSSFVLANIICSFYLHKAISFGGLLIRTVLLFLSFAVMIHNVNYRSIKDSSLCLQWLSKVKHEQKKENNKDYHKA